MEKLGIAALVLFMASTGWGVRVHASESEYAGIKDQLTLCATCHGAEGVPADGQYPILAGQEFYYLYLQLKDYKSGLRANPIMGPVAAGLEKEEMQALAKYFSEKTWPARKRAVSKEVENTALSVINSGQCVACHLSAFNGNSRVPRLAGQNLLYLTQTMLDYKTRARNNAPDKATLLATYTEEELKRCAEYLSGLE